VVALLTTHLGWRRWEREDGDEDEDEDEDGDYLPRLIVGLLIGALVALILRLLQRLKGDAVGGQTGAGVSQTQGVPPKIYRRPDPFIYDQYYLVKLGYAVSWHNPDVRLEDPLEAVPPGTPRTAVDSSLLQPGKAYDVVARIWNGSTSAPAVHMPVSFSYLEFGIGTTKHQIGTTHVDLSVRGASGCPAYARQSWTTPSTPGHYCLQVELTWPDDANPDNNLGQHNTDVKPLNSPNAQFTFPVRNNADLSRELRVEVDAYRIGELPECEPATGTRGMDPRRAHGAGEGQRRADHPVPEGWTVDLQPARLRLEAGAQEDLTVQITAPDGFTGLQAFNVHAFADLAPVGGVTLYVHG